METFTVFISPQWKRVKKVWGEEFWLVNNEKYCAKLLRVLPMGMCSLHLHLVKDETFTVLAGKVSLEHEGKVVDLGPGDSRRIPVGTWHRFHNRENFHPSAPACVPATILETSTTHDDADVERMFPSVYFGAIDGD